MRWVKSKIGNEVSNTAIMCNDYHIARFITYANDKKIEKYSLTDCSQIQHKFIAWFDTAEQAKEYATKLIKETKNANT